MITKQEVIRLNNYCDLDNLLSIKEIKSDEDRKKYSSNGYIIGFTIKEFEEKFPNITAANIFYDNTGLIPRTIYFDKSRYIFIDLPIWGKEELLTYGNQSAEDSILSAIQSKESDFNENDFTKLFMGVPDAVAVNLISKLIKSTSNPTFDLYNIFFNLYSNIDYGFSFLDKEDIVKVFSLKSEKAKNKTKKLINNFPETMTIYRGESDKSTDYKRAFSWTTDINIANFFAIRLAEKSARVITAKIKKEDILEYYNGRNEKEVIIIPDKIEVININNMDSISDENIDFYIKNTLDIYFKYKNILLNEEWNKSDAHGKLHSLRVLLLCLILCEKLNIFYKYKELLAEVCVFHDISRTTDYEDDIHGEKSYEIYTEKYPDNKLIKFLMEYHCKDDEIAYTFLEKTDFENKNDVKKLYNIFKDADALDRVRFGLKDLDINFLRNEESKNMIFVAQQLLDGIRG